MVVVTTGKMVWSSAQRQYVAYSAPALAAFPTSICTNNPMPRSIMPRTSGIRKNAMIKANSTVLAPCRAAKTRRINRTILRPCSMGLLHQFGHAMTRHAGVGGAAQLTECCAVTAAHVDGESDELVAHRGRSGRITTFIGDRLGRRIDRAVDVEPGIAGEG